MHKKELIVLSVIASAMVIISVIGYVRKSRLKKQYEMIVREMTVQISVNEADEDALQRLPGIGPSLARKIVEYREKNGGFERLENLKNVKGIGDNLFQNLLPYIRL
jgi:comEA protein